MYPSVTTKVGDIVGTACSYIYISILFCLSPELQLHQLPSYRQLPLIIVVDLWLVLEFFLFSFFFFWCSALCHMTFGNSGLGVFLALLPQPPSLTLHHRPRPLLDWYVTTH